MSINLVLVLISIPFKKKNLLKNSVCVWCVEVRGQPEGVASLLLPYGLGTELRLSGLMAGAFLLWVIRQPLSWGPLLSYVSFFIYYLSDEYWSVLNFDLFGLQLLWTIVWTCLHI